MEAHAPGRRRLRHGVAFRQQVLDGSDRGRGQDERRSTAEQRDPPPRAPRTLGRSGRFVELAFEVGQAGHWSLLSSARNARNPRLRLRAIPNSLA